MFSFDHIFTTPPYGHALIWYGETVAGGEIPPGEKWYQVVYVDDQGNHHTGWVAGEYNGEVWIADQEAQINEKVAPMGVAFAGDDLESPEILNELDRETGDFVPIEPGENASQIIGSTYGEDSVGPTWPRYVDEDGTVYATHMGLCGQTVIAAILNRRFPVNMNQVVDVFVNQARKGIAPDYTRGDELENLINEYFGDFLHADFETISEQDGVDDLPAVMEEWLVGGDYIIAGVGINGSTGELTSSGIGHWVAITGIGSDPKTGTQWVRIYNPFDNETEYYTWEFFKESWSGNVNMQGYHYLHIENLPSPPPPILYNDG